MNKKTKAEVYVSSGLSKRKEGKLPEAIEDFSEAIRLVPEYAEAYLLRGLTKFENKDVSGAYVDINEVIRLKPFFVDAYKIDRKSSSARRGYPVKLADFKEYIHILPQVYWLRGREKFKKNDYYGAIEEYTNALKLDPENDRYYSARGNVKFALHDHEGVIADFTEAIRHCKRGCADYYRYRGNSLKKLGNDLEAKADYEKAKQLEELE